jgi:carbon storage regulator
MLALTRRVGEEIVIGDPTNPLGVIRVVDIHGDKVRLAFDFPRSTEINRKELADEKAKNATEEATQEASGSVRLGSGSRRASDKDGFQDQKTNGQEG